MRVKTHTAASFLLQSSKGSNHSVGRFFWLAAERGTPGRLAFSDVGWFASAAGEKPAAKRHKRRKEGKNSAEQAAHAVALAHRAEQRREGEANGPRGQRPPGASRTGPSWTEFVRPAHQAVGAFAGADMINRAEPRACGHSREPIPPDSEPEAERNVGSASNATGDGGGRARSDQAGFQKAVKPSDCACGSHFRAPKGFRPFKNQNISPSSAVFPATGPVVRAAMTGEAPLGGRTLVNGTCLSDTIAYGYFWGQHPRGELRDHRARLVGCGPVGDVRSRQPHRAWSRPGSTGANPADFCDPD